jgi:hypothetical protein
VKNSVIALLFHCCVYVFINGASGASAGQDDPTIVSFTRHTFRGVAKDVGPQAIALKEYGIDITIPLLSYVEDATPRGLVIAKQFGSEGLNKAAACAVRALSGDLKFCEPQADIGDQTFDGHWDEFRTDLSTQRTFWTAIKVREGLEESLRKPTQPRIALRGCKTTPGKAIDPVCTRQSVMSRVPLSAPDVELLALFKKRSESFLAKYRASIGIDDPMPALPAPYYFDGKILPNEYEEVAKLANVIEMASALGQPIPLLVQPSTIAPPRHEGQGKAVVMEGLNMLGVRFFIANPQLVADNISVQALNYMASRTKGTHTAVFTHDDYISALLHSLGFITRDSDPSQLAIYPLETIVFAFRDHHVAVSRTRLTVQVNGSIPENEHFQDTTLVWHGSLHTWNEMAGEVTRRARHNGVIFPPNTCDNETIEVLY